VSDQRGIILDAAVLEFAEVGITSQSLHGVAQRAGLEYRAVRALYPDEKALLLGVLGELTEPLIGAISVAVQDTESPSELIEMSFRLLDQWLLEHPRYMQLVRQCMVADRSVLATLFQSSLYPSEFVERFERFVAEGKIQEKDVVMVMVFFDSLLFFPHLMGVFLKPDGTPAPPGEFLERRTQAMMNMLQGGLLSSR
jgi:AcrR family transcriptional regulator